MMKTERYINSNGNFQATKIEFENRLYSNDLDKSFDFDENETHHLNDNNEDINNKYPYK